VEKRSVRLWAACLVALLCFAGSQTLRAALPDRFASLYEKAQSHEDRGRWADACACYDQIFRADRSEERALERYRICLRHALQMRRFRDPSLKAVLKQGFPEALDAYEEILNRLLVNYVERDSLKLHALFKSGVTELRFALEDETFAQEHLTGLPPEKVRGFINQLDQWPQREIRARRDARDQARALSLEALERLGINPTAVVLELTCGLCNALDEYTAYLTPAQLTCLQASLTGESVGVGVEVGVVDQKLVVTSLVANSPAADKGLKVGDRITRVEGQNVENHAPESVTAKLLGKPGTAVELEFVAVGETMTQSIRLTRQAIFVPSVERLPLLADGVGYVRILSFQESTAQELKDAVLHLQTQGMKALVLDLRGNGGGVFQSAIHVAEMFLPGGVIVTTDSPFKQFRKTFKSQNTSALALPLVVLVDGETASAAEVLAGALKENGRATLVGATTFGKGCLQRVLPLENVPAEIRAGIKVTVMNFFSPTNQPYTGRGISPHVVVPYDIMDAQRNAGIQQARQMLAMMR
jgi:carboxyl-terminal processing protease